MNPTPRPAVLLSLASAACAALACAATLAWSGSFPDYSPPAPYNAVLAEARGWSAVTLGMALPILVTSMVTAVRGSLRGRLAWLGSMAYLVYTYLEFAVSPPFTALYLVYITAFSCALAALVTLAGSIDMEALRPALGQGIPRRAVAVFSLLFAGLLASAWLKDIAARTAAGQFGWPAPEPSVAHVVHALDLGLLVPLGGAAGILLFRGRPSGVLLASILLVVAVCMSAALTAMVAWSAASSGGDPRMAVPFAIVWVISVGLAAPFFWACRAPAETEPSGAAGAPAQTPGNA